MTTNEKGGVVKIALHDLRKTHGATQWTRLIAEEQNEKTKNELGKVQAPTLPSGKPKTSEAKSK